MSLLGVDVGTTGCKAAAFAADGRCLASAYREHDVIHARPDWSELDSRGVLEHVWEVIAAVASHTGGDPITALSISAMGEAMTPVSRDREVLGTSILSSDPRGGEYAEALARGMGQEALYAINPNILGPNYSLPKLLWIRDHQPDLYQKTWKFLLWGDLVAFLLGAEPVTSFSHANRTLLFDVREECWSDELLGFAGLPAALLPAPVSSGTIAGVVSRPMAERLGLPADVAVVVGGHDQCCNALGAGVRQAGSAVCGIGTFQCITACYDRIPPAAPMLRAGLNVEHHVLTGLYVSFLYNQAGSLVRWFRNTFAAADRRLLPEGQDVYDVLAGEMPADPSRLLVLPYFEMTGPPGFITDAAGAIVGLKTSTSRGEILKAIMEAVALYFVDSLDALKELGIRTDEFVATGGGARSDPWLQTQADVLGVPFVRPSVTEGSTLGAAMLAGMATGVFADAADAASRCVRRERVFEPDERRHRLYRERLGEFRDLLPALRGLMRRLG